MPTEHDLEAIALNDLVGIFEDMKISNIAPMIVHSFDTAKINASLVKRIFPQMRSSHAYLAGLFHDLGLIVYAELRIPRGIIIATKSDVSNEGISFDLDSLISKIDRDSFHSLVSWKMVERMGILPEEFLYAVKNHHTSLEKLEGSDVEIELANALNVADMIAQTLRRRVKFGLSEAVEELTSRMKDYPMTENVRKAFEDLMKDLVEFGYVLDEENHLEKYCDHQVYVLIDQFVEYLKSLVLLLDLRSPFTLRHSSAIAALARDLASEILRTDFDAKVMYIAGLMHDLGKIKTPLEVLHKPSKLTQSEYYVMKMHVVDTFRMFSKYPKLAEFTAIASTHHERLDGSGYPWGLTAEDLGMRSRILQVADVYEALLEDRPYRKGLSAREALKIVEEEVKAGKLDGLVFEKLKEMVENGYRVQKKDIVLFEFFEDLMDLDVIRDSLKKVS